MTEKIDEAIVLESCGYSGQNLRKAPDTAMAEQPHPPWNTPELRDRSLYVQGTVHLEDFLPTHTSRINDIHFLQYCTDGDMYMRTMEAIHQLSYFSPKPCGFKDDYPNVEFDDAPKEHKKLIEETLCDFSSYLDPPMLFDVYLIDSRVLAHRKKVLSTLSASNGYIVADRAPVCGSSKSFKEKLSFFAKEHGKQEHLYFGSYVKTPWEVF